MKRIAISLLFILASCTAKQQGNTQAAFFHPQVNHKLKGKAAVLQKKLSNAERALLEDQSAIERLRSQVCDAELNAIESQIDNLEQKWRSDPQKIAQSLKREVSVLLLEERETLNRIIQNGPEVRRSQVLLDRILQLITQVSDSATTK